MLRKICAWSAIVAAAAVGSAAAAQATGPATDAQTVAQMVAYVAHPEPPKFTDWKSGHTGFMLRGEAKGAGEQIVQTYGIPNYGNETARQIAKAYASAHGLALASAPITVAPSHPLPGARYVVDAGIPEMTLAQLSRSFIWPADPQVYLIYAQDVQILDGATRQVVAKASCHLGYDGGLFAQSLPTHAQVLGDGGAGLKRLVRERADKCIAVLEKRLGLTAAP
jgi:hypothetical protein